MRRTFLCAFAVVMLLSSMANAEAPVNAEQPVTSDPAQNQPKEYQAGQDYIVLPGKSKAAKNSKIKVVSFFWYGCGGCYGVDPYVSDWSKKLPDDVEFVRMPALFNPTWEFHGQIFFALDAMNPKPHAFYISRQFVPPIHFYMLISQVIQHFRMNIRVCLRVHVVTLAE